MRAAAVVFGLGVCAVGALGWTQAKPSASVTLNGVAVQPAPAGISAFWAPTGVRLDGPDPPGPEQKSKPPKAAPGQQGRGQTKGNKPPKVSICHRTDSAERPSKTITVSVRAWQAHEKHGDTRGACSSPSPPGK